MSAELPDRYILKAISDGHGIKVDLLANKTVKLQTVGY